MTRHRWEFDYAYFWGKVWACRRCGVSKAKTPNGVYYCRSSWGKYSFKAPPCKPRNGAQ